jgi:hypothetical protein
VPLLKCAFLDSAFQPTQDLLSGRACVQVSIKDGDMTVAIDKWAVVDTGSTLLYIPPELSVSSNQFDVELSFTELPGWSRTVRAHCYKRDQDTPVLIGRSVLQHFRFVFDLRRHDFTLETD